MLFILEHIVVRALVLSESWTLGVPSVFAGVWACFRAISTFREIRDSGDYPKNVERIHT